MPFKQRHLGANASSIQQLLGVLPQIVVKLRFSGATAIACCLLQLILQLLELFQHSMRAVSDKHMVT